ncbi:hypothetical protein CO669_02365 [Bradyrhizobium sp. Y36]|uniref:hypothetical protein n=1 Tax=Bradyrhizobium sp. Y36 TaxID=2035447 RepID=UPI000BE8FCB7|nr:hypothetical protein [Bradyrhizobium sp. Y36]PDT92131.1 hypothetical protein CO669_02365 [Bradyrhizobium sp. Y36]
MVWFLNIYRCDRCQKTWTGEWSCTYDHECPHCGFRDMSPLNSEKLDGIDRGGRRQVRVLRSSDQAEDDPDYKELGRFSTRDAAKEFLRSYPLD